MSEETLKSPSDFELQNKYFFYISNMERSYAHALILWIFNFLSRYERKILFWNPFEYLINLFCIP